jgi:hypothetical protein
VSLDTDVVTQPKHCTASCYGCQSGTFPPYFNSKRALQPAVRFSFHLAHRQYQPIVFIDQAIRMILYCAQELQ